MQKNSTAPNNKAFAGLSRKAAGSQGRALSRAPQSAKLPFDFRFCENQPKRTKKSASADAQYFAHKVRSWERLSLWTVFPFLYV